MPLRLDISHSESNENPGYANRRSNVRISKDFVLSGSDRVVTGYVQTTISFPNEVVAEGDIRDLLAMMVNFFCTGANPTGGHNIVAGDLVTGGTPFINGEP
jgi:hypothetical protein